MFKNEHLFSSSYSTVASDTLLTSIINSSGDCLPVPEKCPAHPANGNRLAIMTALNNVVGGRSAD